MENKDKRQDESGGSPSAKSMENKVTHMADLMEKLTSEIESVRVSVNKRKTETTTLKILFYTGSFILLLGLIYSTTTLQRAQLKNIESSIAHLQKRTQLELSMTEKILFGELDRLRAQTRLAAGGGLPGALSRMTDALSLIEPRSEKTANLIQQVKQDSEELTQVYLKYQAGLRLPENLSVNRK